MEKITEEAMYEPVRRSLLEKFRAKYPEAYLENTSSGQFSSKLKEALDKSTLYIMRVETMKPDLMGYFRKNSAPLVRIIVEIKAKSLRIHDVYQAKLYGDVMGAGYAILVSSESLTREIREIMKEKNVLHRILWPNVTILKFLWRPPAIIMEPKVLQDLYHGHLPEFLRVP